MGTTSIGFQPVPPFMTHGSKGAQAKRPRFGSFRRAKRGRFAYIAADGPFERNEPVPKEPSFQAYILEAYATLSATPDFLTGLYRSTHTGN
jgi:hypothetical protein